MHTRYFKHKHTNSFHCSTNSGHLSPSHGTSVAGISWNCWGTSRVLGEHPGLQWRKILSKSFCHRPHGCFCMFLASAMIQGKFQLQETKSFSRASCILLVSIMASLLQLKKCIQIADFHPTSFLSPHCLYSYTDVCWHPNPFTMSPYLGTVSSFVPSPWFTHGTQIKEVFVTWKNNGFLLQLDPKKKIILQLLQSFSIIQETNEPAEKHPTNQSHMFTFVISEEKVLQIIN